MLHDAGLGTVRQYLGILEGGDTLGGVGGLIVAGGGMGLGVVDTG